MKSHLLFSLLSVSALWSAPVQRTVLGLYNSQEGPYVVSDYNLVHRAAQMPLNYLGLSVRLHDIAWGIPPEQALEDVFAILCWTNTESSVNADTLCRWLTEQATNGKRLVLMGELPFVFNSVTREPIDRSLIETLFHAIGLRFEGNETSNPLVIKIDWADREMIGFERPLEPGDIPSYRQVRISDPQVQPYLLYSRSDLPESSSVAIATTPNGGYAAPDTALYEEALSDVDRWYINPFLFFERALGLEGMPRFDTTTLFGQRIYYSHIDGDGLRNLSDIDPSKSSGQIIFEEVLQRYPLPFTASFITAEVDPAYIATSDTVQLARSIFQLENVETGSHGFTHPLNWNLGITVFAIPGYSVELDPETAKGANELVESGYKQGARIVVPPKEWYRREIVDSSNYLSSKIAPKEKPIRLYQWTGNCKPPGPAIRMAHDAGLLDINGGDGRLDRAYPTYTKMAPLSRHIDWERQTYTSNANEDIYTNGWHGPYYAQIYVIDTFKQTEIPTLIDGVPRRVAPMNLYFHYYSGEKADSLYAIRYVLEYILATPCIPIFTTHYCEIIDGFYSGEIERLEKNGWRFRHYGKCQTVRLDHTSLWPDLDRSEGVLGYRKWEDYLYIHLTEEGEATLYLSEQETQKPYLVEATAPLWKLRLLPNKISMTSKALGNARFKFANMLPNKTYSVRQKWSSQEEITGVEFTIRSDSYGVLEILAPVHGESELEIQQVAAPS